MYKNFLFFFSLAAALASVEAAPLFTRHEGHDDNAPASDFVKQNGLDAQKLNAQFASMKDTSSCEGGQNACINSAFAQCVNGKWVLTPCSADLKCYALPLVNKAGTSLVCDTEADAVARIAASGATGGIAGSGDANPSPPAASNSPTAAPPSTPAPSSAPTPSSIPAPSSTPAPQNDDTGMDCEDEETDNKGDDNEGDDDCEDDDENVDPAKAGNTDDEHDCEEEKDGGSASVPNLTSAAPLATSTIGNQAAPSSLSSTLSAVQQPVPTSASANGGYNYRRQAFTLVPPASQSVVSTAAASSVSSIAVPTVSPAAPSPTIIAIPSVSSVASASPSTLISDFTTIPTPTAQPTLVSSGAVAVTVVSVSTVFVQATNCAPSVPVPTITSSSSSVIVAPTVVPSIPPTITLSLPKPSASGIIVNPPGTVTVNPSASDLPSSSVSAASESAKTGSTVPPKFTFFPAASTQTPTPTPTPTPTATPTSTFNLSDLLTATVAV